MDDECTSREDRQWDEMEARLKKCKSEKSKSFTKYDGRKNRLELIEPEFIEGIGRIVTFGAEKYSAHNWKKAMPEDIERIKGSLLRHILTYLKGVETDDETGESHLYHATCNIMFLDYFDRIKDNNEG